MKIIVAALLAVLVAACAGNAPVEESVGSVNEAFLTPRAEYDTSLSWEEIVKPHFFPKSKAGEFLPQRGRPDRVMIRVMIKDGRVKIQLNHGGQTQYLDPLALGSERLGEHPVHKVFRLKAMGVSVDQELEERLEAPGSIDRLFHALDFEYLKGQRARGTVAEVYPDGTFLVIPFDPPEAWQSDRPQVASPSHLHVNSRALSVADSPLAQGYETKILSLSFDQQRYPPADVARQQCGVYQESLANPVYRGILDSVGYRFTPQQVVSQNEQGPTVPFGEMVRSLVTEGAGRGVDYSGFEGSWVADRLLDLKVSWLEECDTVGGIRSYVLSGDSGKSHYLHVRRSLEPDKKQRYKIVKLENDGSARVIYDAPGAMLMAMPVPGEDSRWIMSTEGWPAAGGGIPADPRWQAVYIVNINDPDDYQKVEFPIHQYPRAPEAGLYGASARFSDDQRFLFNTLYGFRDEGGGIWVTDLSVDNFHQEPEAFRRIVEWDHALSWTLLDPELLEGTGDGAGDGSGSRHLFLTGKEVADNFAMTANVLRVSGDGLDSAIQSQRRLFQMVGWNPVPFSIQKLSGEQFLVAVETHFDYESSLLPRARGVYIVPVDLSLVP